MLIVFRKDKRDLPRRIDADARPSREPIPVVRDATPAEWIIPSKPETVKVGRRLTPGPVTSDPFVGHCELPSDVDLKASRVYLDVSEPKPEAAAAVTINGRYVGGFIGGPYRLEVSDHPKRGRNEIILTPFAPEQVRLLVY